MGYEDTLRSLKIKDKLFIGGQILGNVMNTSGVVRYVDQQFGSDNYDGSSWTSAKATIQAGVDVCPGSPLTSPNWTSGDVVLVAPGKYQENVRINGRTSVSGVVTVKGHDGIKIIAVVPGWETRIRTNDATTKLALTGGGVHQDQTACAFVVMARSVEISGFCIDGDSAAYCGIYAGDGVRSGYRTGSGGNASSLWVHDCLFQQGGYGVLLDGAGSFCKIENNVFMNLSYAGVYNCPGGGRQTERPIVRYNEFFLGSAACGVDMYSVSGTASKTMIIEGNTFADGPSLVGTFGVRTYGGGVHIIANNKFACANSESIQLTDYTSGNLLATTGKTTNATYVSEA